MNKRIYLSCPTMHGEEQQFIQEAFETNWVAPLGPNVDKFESEMAKHVGIGYAAALSAGTAALHLAIKLAGVKAGDTVFVSSLTFSATCNPITYENATPVFVDSERDTWNMSPEALRKAFEKYPNTKVVVVVHLYGTPCKLDEILEICKQHDAILIEDAAESLGSTYKGKMTGTFGKYGIYSFNGNKIITTSGGGMLVSECEESIAKARFWATQAREKAKHYEHKEIGYNYRMSNVLAGIGRGQLLHLDEHVSLKRKIYERYREGLKDLPLQMNPYMDCTEPNFWLSCILLDEDCKVKPEEIGNKLEEHNIEGRPIWKPMHMQPVFEDCDYITTDEGVDVGADVFKRGFCLPSDIKMTEEEQDKVIALIRECFAEV